MQSIFRKICRISRKSIIWLEYMSCYATAMSQLEKASRTPTLFIETRNNPDKAMYSMNFIWHMLPSIILMHYNDMFFFTSMFKIRMLLTVDWTRSSLYFRLRNREFQRFLSGPGLGRMKWIWPWMDQRNSHYTPVNMTTFICFMIGTRQTCWWLNNGSRSIKGRKIARSRKR